ncbi:MAG: GNAT family N-acetyltransferase [Solirubrobacterales bacterium]
MSPRQQRPGRPGRGGGAGSELDLALTFLAGLDEAVAGEVVDLGWGTGVFDRDRPVVWDANYVRVGAGSKLTAGELAEEVEPRFVERNLLHRMLVFFDSAPDQRLVSGFGELGWEAAHETVMAWRGPVASPAQPVEEISVSGYEEAKRDFELAEPPGGADPAIAPALVDQLASRDALIREVAAERRFAVVVDQRAVSACVLYSGQGIGQVESVTTEPEHRNRGYGRAIVQAAVAASVERGDRLTFLIALIDDWPRQMYRRMGFEPLGTVHRFRLAPPPLLVE